MSWQDIIKNEGMVGDKVNMKGILKRNLKEKLNELARYPERDGCRRGI